MPDTRLNELQRLLGGLAPEDPRERAFLDRMLALSRDQGALSREHYVPGHFTASAFVLCPEAEHLLLIHHGKLLRWLQPGGHIDPQDTSVVAAALREVQEETRVICAPPDPVTIFDIDIHTIPARGETPSHEHFDLRLLLRAPDKRLLAGSDALAARWVRLDRVEAEVNTDESVLRAVRKLRAL